jgi:hypothetical protein
LHGSILTYDLNFIPLGKKRYVVAEIGQQYVFTQVFQLSAGVTG